MTPCVYYRQNGIGKMNLNINSNMNAIGASRLVGAALSESHIAKSRANNADGFTITHAVVSPEDVEAAAIPDETLSRGDSLGALIGRVFSLPPPLMPNFANF